MKVPVDVSEMQHEYKKEGVNVYVGCIWLENGVRELFTKTSRPLLYLDIMRGSSSRVLTRFDSSWSCSLSFFFF